MTQQHTPGPWQWHPLGKLYFVPQKDFSVICNVGINQNVACSIKESDAEFIVRACNSHDALLAALEGAQSVIRKTLPELEADSTAIYAGEWLDTINSVLAQARGE